MPALRLMTGPIADPRPRSRKALVYKCLAPLLLWALLMLLIAVGVRSKSGRAIAPPIGDAIEYLYKAKTTWQYISKGDLGALLEAPPSRRPPLGPLILYPLGFETSIQSFFFRSTFFPVVVTSYALLILLLPKAATPLEKFLAVAIASTGASMPFLYHFEPFSRDPIGFWGLIDPLFSAFGALAVSFVSLGVQRRSWPWGLAGWAAAALAIFIKPVGILIALISFGISWAESLILLLQDKSSQANESVKKKLVASTCFYAVAMSVIALGLCAATITVAMGSSYLGKENRELFVSGTKIMRAWQTNQPFVPVLLGILPTTVGWFWLLALVSLVLSILIHIRWNFNSARVGPLVRLIAVSLILGCAFAWWWYIASPQPRYLFPFLLIAVTWLSQDILGSLKRCSDRVQMAAAIFFFAPFLGIITLLWMSRPPPAIQNFLGVNLCTGAFPEEVNLGHKLVAECAHQRKPLRLYNIGGNRSEVAIGVQQYLRYILEEPGYSFSIIGPIDWLREPGIRLDELASSDLVLCERSMALPIGERPLPSPSNFYGELHALVNFLNTTASDADGLQLFGDGALQAYRIIDRAKFSVSLAKWAKKVRWNTAFPEHNKAFLEKHFQDST
jgi:hypothetical protein